MNTEQTPTPITDAEADHARNLLLDYDCQGKDDNIPVPIVVPVEVARNLERQLAEANEVISMYRESKSSLPRYISRRELAYQLVAERALADRLAHSMERMRMECYSKAYEEWKEARK